MKRKFFVQLLSVLVVLAFSAVSSFAIEATVTSGDRVKAGHPVTVKGKIDPGQDLFVVICTDKMFKPADSKGAQEKDKLTKKFGDTAIPPTYYVITNKPEDLATPKSVAMGQTVAPLPSLPSSSW